MSSFRNQCAIVGQGRSTIQVQLCVTVMVRDFDWRACPLESGLQTCNKLVNALLDYR